MKFFFLLILLFLNLAYADPNQAEQEAVQAVLDGDIQVLSSLLDKGVIDVNFQDSHKNSLLHYAVIVGLTEIVDVLLVRGADLSTKDRFGQTALQVAQMTKNSPVISRLESAVQIKPVRLHQEDNIVDLKAVSDFKKAQRVAQEQQQIRKALQQAIQNTDPHTLRNILSNEGKQIINDVFTIDGEPYTFLLLSIEQAQLNKLDADFQPNSIEVQRLIGEAKKVIEILIEFSADVNAVVRTLLGNETPLNVATFKNLHEIVVLLLEAGANPNFSPDNITITSPLGIALGNSNFALALKLLAYGTTDINFEFSEETLLDYFVSEEDVPVVLFLLKNGADPNKTPALASAIDNDNAQLTQMLLVHGADPLLPYSPHSSSQKSILKKARQISNPEVVQLMESSQCQGTLSILSRT